MLATILEEINTNIPKDIQKEIKKMSWRREQPVGVFLDPTNLKFPVKYDGEYRCDMIHAALIFSAIYSKKGSAQQPAKYYKDIHEKAKMLSDKQQCSKDTVKLNETEEVTLAELFEVYSIEALHELDLAIQG